jgi:hypothetical protein
MIGMQFFLKKLWIEKEKECKKQITRKSNRFEKTNFL